MFGLSSRSSNVRPQRGPALCPGAAVFLHRSAPGESLAKAWLACRAAARSACSPALVSSPPSFHSGPRSRFVASEGWRRGRDSNPRPALTGSGFQDRRDRPLCHLSKFADWLSEPQPGAICTHARPAFATLRRGSSRSRFAPSEGWHGVRDSNPQPTVLETATLPIELTPYSPSPHRRLPIRPGGGRENLSRAPKQRRPFRRLCP